MTTPVLTEDRHPLLVDCPLCDGPARLDTTCGELDCSACGICLELAPDQGAILPAAA